VSSTARPETEVPETPVLNRSRFAHKLHRPSEDSDEVQPACPMQELGMEFTEVPGEAYVGHYALCRNPECFGRDWR